MFVVAPAPAAAVVDNDGVVDVAASAVTVVDVAASACYVVVVVDFVDVGPLR